MSFFGFGFRRDSESDIPLSSNHSGSQAPAPAAAAAPASPPQGPPPTNPAFVNSPALSPLRNSGSSNHSAEARETLAIPNIHIFNPSTAEQHQEAQVAANDDVQVETVDPQEEQAEDEVNLKLSFESFDTADGEYQHQEEQYGDNEHWQEGETAQEWPQEEETQWAPEADAEGYGQHPDEGAVEYQNGQETAEGVWQHEEGAGEYQANVAEGGEWQPAVGLEGNQEQEEPAQYDEAGYSTEGGSHYETASSEGGASYKENVPQPQPQPQFSTVATDSPESVTTPTEEPAPVESPTDEYQPEDVEEGDEEDDVFPTTDPNFPATTPLRETSFENNGEYRPSPILSYSDDSRSSMSLGTTPPNSTNRFRTPIKESKVLFDTSLMNGELNPKSPREAIFTPQFKEVHAKTVRRRQNLQHNMQNLERRLASITSNLANLTMDREAKQCKFMKENVCAPMEKATERMQLEREYQTSPHYTGTKSWMSLTTRLSHLDTDLTKQANVKFPKTLRTAMEQPYATLNQELSPALAEETKKSEKREGSLYRQFESVAATARRRYHEERASRFGAYEVMRQQVLAEAKVESDPKRLEELISRVRILRSKLEQERVERRMRDEHLKTAIEQEVISMKRALLEAAGGDDFMAEAEDVRKTIAYY